MVSLAVWHVDDNQGKWRVKHKIHSIELCHDTLGMALKTYSRIKLQEQWNAEKPRNVLYTKSLFRMVGRDDQNISSWREDKKFSDCELHEEYGQKNYDSESNKLMSKVKDELGNEASQQVRDGSGGSSRQARQEKPRQKLKTPAGASTKAAPAFGPKVTAKASVAAEEPAKKFQISTQLPSHGQPKSEFAPSKENVSARFSNVSWSSRFIDAPRAEMIPLQPRTARAQ